jgi:hypothetical protein
MSSELEFLKNMFISSKRFLPNELPDLANGIAGLCRKKDSYGIRSPWGAEGIYDNFGAASDCSPYGML